jgi:hypothetical protein
MSALAGPPPLPKLPIWDIVGLAYSGYFRNFADVLRASWLWLLLGAVANGVVSWQQWSLVGIAVLSSAQQTQLPPDFAMAMFASLAPTIVVANAVLILALVSIAVAWHRRIILDERPSFLNFNIATGNFWRYIGVGLAIALLALLPIALAFIPIVVTRVGSGAPTSMMALAANPGIAAIAIPLLLVAYIVGIAVVLRLSLLLPARAAGDVELSFARNWRRTRGNCWRMFWGVMICTAVPTIVAEMVLLPMGAPNPASMAAAGPDAMFAFFASRDFIVRMTAVSVGFMAFFMLTLPIGIGFLSFAYRHFFGDAISPAP